MRALPDIDAREDAALWEIVEGTAAETGERFFDRLVLYLARSLSTRYAWVTEWLEAERRLRALSFWIGDGYRGEFEYAVADTPCEVVVRSRDLVHVPERVIDLYPGDADLGTLGAVSYMGVPLLDDDGRLLGHLAVMHDAPMPKSPRADAIFRPGNVRELHNVIERALITSTDGRRLNLARALPDGVAAPGSTALAHTGASNVADGPPILTAADLQELERRNISRALEATGGKISGLGGAAALLGLNPNTLASRMKSLGIPRPGGAR